MFYGEFQHTLDAKGRIIVPSKFRDGLGFEFIVTKGLENCLFAYSMNEWREIEAKIKQLPFTDKDVRAFTRFFFAGAAACELDKQGRIVIPQNLRSYASLEKDVVVAGISNRVEIWDRQKWDEYNSSDFMNDDSVAEKMAMLGI